MSKVDLNPVFEGFTRKMGNLVFYTRRGDTFARRRTSPSNPNSTAQQSVRGAFTYVAELWKGSDGALRTSWERYARGKKYTGYNAFLGENAPKKRQGASLELIKEMGEEPLMDFTAAPGAAAGQVTASFTMPPESSGKHLTVFAQDGGADAAYRPLRRYDLGAGAASPVAINGLEAGKPYHLYAVLSDAAYAGATSVSASVAAEVVAGS